MKLFYTSSRQWKKRRKQRYTAIQTPRHLKCELFLIENMNVFEEIKSALDMRTVAEGYGLSINRSGMTLCPFHDERTPSAKIYDDNFHCFGCGEHLDIIGFTGKMFGLSPIESVKKLNADFWLDIAVNGTPDKHEISEYQKRKTEREQYAEWEKSAWITLDSYVKMLRNWKEIYAPKTPDDTLDKRFVYALHNLDYAEYLCEEFIKTDYRERSCFKEHTERIRKFLGNEE